MGLENRQIPDRHRRKHPSTDAIIPRFKIKIAIFDGNRYKTDKTVAGSGDTGYVHTAHLINQTTGAADSSQKVQFKLWNSDGTSLLNANEKVEIIGAIYQYQKSETDWLTVSTYGERFNAARIQPKGGTATVVLRVAKVSSFSSGTYTGVFDDGISTNGVSWTMDNISTTTQTLVANDHCVIFQHAGTGAYYGVVSPWGFYR